MARQLAIGSVRLSTSLPRIVAAGGERELDALVAATDADLVELRADLFDDPRPASIVAALERLRTAGRPVTRTFPAAAEGVRPLPDAVRRPAGGDRGTAADEPASSHGGGATSS